MRPGLSEAGKRALVLRVHRQTTPPMDRRSNFCAAQRAAADSERFPASLRCPMQPGHEPEKQRLKFLSAATLTIGRSVGG